ncbi:hypothetical protein EBB56_09295 [Halomonas sp. YLB-10]|uniref:hypothetical protein n=1 Tax=Halomonas sp. YLB-10 TaxID=2483111 RepID=UPI000F5E941D|nr:hypothetical protein [Halomonas sp. YLB-10]RQW71345.1 hypothetical protein EBB56_09295 [Halomonas sp. YLB-10]
MSILSLVKLYRIVERPTLSKGSFSGSVELSEVRELILEISKSGMGRFNELVFNDEDYDGDPSKLPNSSGQLQFEVKPHRSSEKTFHQNIADLLKNDPKIGKGQFPADFYLVEEDYFAGSSDANPSVDSLKKICCLIDSLSKLAHYHDAKAKSRFFRLVFIKPEEVGVSQALVLETMVDEEILELAQDIEVSRLIDLCDSDQSKDAHYREKVGVFGNTVSEFVKGKPESEKPFHYLVRNWGDFLETFDKNLAVYISGFAFHKAKREVAEAEVDISSKLSGILGDIAGKLLSIPVSFAAVALIPKAGDILRSSIIVLGLMITSWIVSELLKNQSRRLRRVVHSKNIILNSIEGKRETYPEDLKKDVDKITHDLDDDEKRIQRLIRIYLKVCWLPAVAALIVHVYFALSGFSS